MNIHTFIARNILEQKKPNFLIMKKLTLSFLAILFLMSQAAFSQDSWISLNGSSPGFPDVQVESQDMKGMTLSITVPGFYAEQVVQDGITYQQLRFEAWQTLHKTGLPELPVISEVIALPGDKLAKVKVLETESVTLDNMLVYPSRLLQRIS